MLGVQIEKASVMRRGFGFFELILSSGDISRLRPAFAFNDIKFHQ